MLYKEFDAKDIQIAVELALTADAGSSATVEHNITVFFKAIPAI